jgi:hypothetical protein
MRGVKTFAAVSTLAALLVMACGEDEPVDVTGPYWVDYNWDVASDTFDVADNRHCPGSMTIFEQAGEDLSGHFSAVSSSCEIISSGPFTATLDSDGAITSPDLFVEFFSIDGEACVVTDGVTEMRGQLSGDELTLRTAAEFLCDDAAGVYDIWFDLRVVGTHGGWPEFAADPSD